jgi:hypothetical protein
MVSIELEIRYTGIWRTQQKLVLVHEQFPRRSQHLQSEPPI